MKYIKLFEKFTINEGLDSTETANKIKATLESKKLKGLFGSSLVLEEVLKPEVDFVISTEKLAWGIGTFVYFKNTPEMQAIAKEIYETQGGDYSQSFEQGKVVGVTGIGYKK